MFIHVIGVGRLFSRFDDEQLLVNLFVIPAVVTLPVGIRAQLCRVRGKEACRNLNLPLCFRRAVTTVSRSVYEGLGQKKGSLISARKRVPGIHTVLFWDGKALAYHTTGLFNMEEGLSRMQEGFFSISVGVFGMGDGL